MKFRSEALLLIASAVLWGCSPFGQKSEPKELFPADSVSRAIAQSVVVETLVLNYRLDAGEDAYFSTILLGPDTTLWLGDLGRHAIRRFTYAGDELESIDGFSFPYLIALAGDTATVYDAGLNRVVTVGDSPVGLDLPPVDGEQTALSRQVSVADGAVYVKDAGKPSAALYRIESRSNELLAALPGPSWHHHGVLRSWQGKVLSVSSYRPIVYTFDPDVGLDSMRLQGFDSPMLARVRAYTLGSIKELPLMISGVFGSADELYVINVRPGILRLDVFDSSARLTRVLQFEEPQPTGFTPVDLVVRSEGDSTYAFVASVSTVYGPLSLRYASQLDRFAFPSEPAR